jgi:hypothetical protein
MTLVYVTRRTDVGRTQERSEQSAIGGAASIHGVLHKHVGRTALVYCTGVLPSASTPYASTPTSTHLQSMPEGH